jgi:PAS domain S-box-containing protein
MLVDQISYRTSTTFERLVKHIKWVIPEGGSLPDEAWQSRHWGILLLLWLHAVGMVCFGLLVGASLWHSLIEGAVLALIAAVATWVKGDRLFRSATASLGLITASAELVHLGGGYIELHFHFFVMLAVIVLYQDWFPFLLAIGYVVLHHGAFGVFYPEGVFNHPDAFAHPWKWAAIHGGFVLAASIAGIVSWRLNELLWAYSELVLNSTGEGIIGLDLEGKITFTNPAAAEMTGYQVQELKGRCLSGLLHPPGLLPENENWFQNLTRADSVKSVNQGVFWRKNGLSFMAEYISTPIRQAGIVVGAVVAFKDVTERTQAQEALQKAKDELEIRVVERTAELNEANERLRFELAERQRAEEALAKRAAELEESRNFLDSIIENIPHMLFTKDATDLRFIHFNGAGKEILGLDATEMIGKSDYDLFPQREADFFTAKDREVLFAGKPVDIPEEPIQTAHKGTRLLHTRKIPILGANSQPKYLLGISEDITERKQVEKALRHGEERTRLIINTALDAVITMDAAGLITDWNTQAEAIFGWSRQDILGRPLAETIIPIQHREAHNRGLKQFLATGEGPVLYKRIEITGLHREGHEFPIELSISPLRLEEDIIFSAFVRDITERKRAEADLIDSEARYKAITSTMPGAIYQFTSRNGVWTVDYMAPQTLELFGISAEDFMQDINNFIRHIYPDDLPLFVASVTEVVEKLTPWNYEGRVTNPITGELVWWQGMSTPVRTTSGETIFNGILLNITERKRAEAALRESEQRFRQVVSSISDHIYVTELTEAGQRLNLYLSHHIEPLTGYPWARFIADWSFWPSTVIHPDDRAAAAAQAQRLALGQNSELEYRLVRADGSVIWVRDSGRVEREPIRQSLIIYGLVSDITERKQAEAVLARARDEALASSRLKTELLAKVSHELRTPLGAILGFAEILELNISPYADKQKRMTAEIIDSTHYLTKMVNELLDQAQLEAGRLELNLQPFAPADLLADTLARMSVLAQAKGLSLMGEIAPNVPFTLAGDTVRLQQILVNLISNAIKFTAAGTVQVRLYCPDAGHWALQVSDTGAGIPVEAQTYIFEPFRQVDGSMTRENAGTGLGLSIVKQLTTLMGGQITLVSAAGQGSTFTIFLPIQLIQKEVV